MIGRVLERGRNVRGALYYLYGPGMHNEHVDPRIVAGWRPPDVIEPPSNDKGKRDFTRLTALLELPLALLGDHAPVKPAWHCTLSAASEDPVLEDSAWAAIAGDVMHRTGLNERGREDEGVPWVAVRHADNHVHIVAILARVNGRHASLRNDFYRIGEVLAWAECQYGLKPLARADRTAGRRPTRARVRSSPRGPRRAAKDHPPPPGPGRRCHSALGGRVLRDPEGSRPTGQAARQHNSAGRDQRVRRRAAGRPHCEGRTDLVRGASLPPT